MNPQVEAAVIAGIVSLISLGGTVAVAVFGFRTTKTVTEKAVQAGHEDTRETLTEQRKQLDKTFAEQREQLDSTLAEQHIRTLNERFATAAEKLGGDKPPAVRLAGVYAMAGLADDWEDNRQVCIDVLCGYLRIASTQLSDEDGEETQRDLQADREVRHALIRTITAHLRDGAAVSWQGKDFDLTGVVFDGGDFRGARFSGGTVDFGAAQFLGPVDFRGAQFTGAKVNFGATVFSFGPVNFEGSMFSGGMVDFIGALFSGGLVNFNDAEFVSGTVRFRALFRSSTVYYVGAQFTGAEVDFSLGQFSGGTVSFLGAKFSGGTVSFLGAEFSGGTVDFRGVLFSGATVVFDRAQFSGGTVDFHGSEGSHPPQFDWGDGAPPKGVRLPR